ncbi:bi-domain-containing oxidoreductase [Bradyrhizobium sp.]|uniref:bi-domain-containing oxidoreductase n=1 Tax=Bradyrhizobium sp. TaxID=376 RepID=UPI003C77A02D
MKQVLQDLGTGETMLAEVPAPALSAGSVLIRTRRTLISAGTERMLVDFGRASLFEKARQQPDKVKMVLDKVRTDGLITTFETVRGKLDQPLALGYCNAGVVLEAGAGVTEFRPGDRVVSNGPHADIVCVAKNLCAAIPEPVSDEAAAFTVLGAIGLQGIRLAQPTIGETVVVTGLGLIGLMVVQVLRANGCRVIGIDLDARRLDLARQFGAHCISAADSADTVAAAIELSDGKGVDAVIITASTSSNEPVSQAARMSRKRGRIVLIGVTGLELNRAEFYQKELTFQVSCSYGPGRYDPAYETGGHDYPLGFVRWTEQRNFEAVLALMADQRLEVGPLVSHRFSFESAASAYEKLTTDVAALGVILEYAPAADAEVLQRRVALGAPVPVGPTASLSEPVMGFIGAGNYGSRMLIPAFKATGVRLQTVVTSSGASGVHHGKKAGFAMASTDVSDVLADQTINAAVIVTRHNTHAQLVVQALEAGKHVFVEKPLALTIDEIDRIRTAWGAAQAVRTAPTGAPHLMVGFNRRFAPLVAEMKSLLDRRRQPKAFVYTCNAGAIPADHWTQDPVVGGGRIIGEACHFIDLLRFLAGSPIRDARITTMGRHPALATTDDKAIITLSFEDGSIGTILYFANGGKVFPKERVEVFSRDAVLQLNNFISLRGYGWPGFTGRKLWRQDKGQVACARAFVDAIRRGEPAPIAADELFEVARVSVKLALAQREH